MPVPSSLMLDAELSPSSSSSSFSSSQDSATFCLERGLGVVVVVAEVDEGWSCPLSDKVLDVGMSLSSVGKVSMIASSLSLVCSSPFPMTSRKSTSVSEILRKLARLVTIVARTMEKSGGDKIDQLWANLISFQLGV